MDKAPKSAINFGGYLERHGELLLKNGFNIVPIEPGKKAPGFDGWQKTRATPAILTKWLDNGRRHYGVGIITTNTPGVDIDVVDDELSKLLEDWCLENIGPAPVRVGMAPKRLLLYGCEEPFRKITSKTYVNEWGERCRVEILGEGQQFVAYHIHPDTQRPYTWTSDIEPLNTDASELTLITVDQCKELIQLFEAEARNRGWQLAKGSRIGNSKVSGAQPGQVDYNDPFAADAQKVVMSQAELQQRLMMAPGNEDYDTWLQVGMALFHQFDGEEIGREMWHEWSEMAENYDADALDRKWSTFDIAEKGRSPVTARLILQLAKEAAETAAIETARSLRDMFAQAQDRAAWNEAAKLATKAEIDHLSRATLSELARERLSAITGSKVPLSEVKKALAYETNTKEMPRWCRDWVYDTSDDKFFHTISKFTVTHLGFNALNDRHSMSKKDVLDGKTAPSASATHLALNVYKIPAVNGRMYGPGKDAIFHYNDAPMANTYPENQVPLKPKSIRPIDKINIKRVKRHFQHLLAGEKEQRHFMDWIAYVVQNPGKRVNYAPLLQGVQGDGKSFFAFLLAAVMGQSNVRQGNAHILEGSFTGWAEGQCVMAIEEIRLIGHNRYDVLNRIKPFITNDVVEIHPKGRNPYNVQNTTNYILFTNYRDALPLSPNERRFLVLFSKWQNSGELTRFNVENPEYYVELYGSLVESAPALRWWLLQHELSEDFNPMGNAPITRSFNYMVNASQQPEMRTINELIAEGKHADITETLLNITFLQTLAMESDLELPNAKTLEKLLENSGFSPLGRHRIGEGMSRFYSKEPDQFQSVIGDELVPDVSKIRRYLKDNKVDEEENEL